MLCLKGENNISICDRKEKMNMPKEAEWIKMYYGVRPNT
jgi:hypothetical protein